MADWWHSAFTHSLLSNNKTYIPNTHHIPYVLHNQNSTMIKLYGIITQCCTNPYPRSVQFKTFYVVNTVNTASNWQCTFAKESVCVCVYLGGRGDADTDRESILPVHALSQMSRASSQQTSAGHWHTPPLSHPWKQHTHQCYAYLFKQMHYAK